MSTAIVIREEGFQPSNLAEAEHLSNKLAESTIIPGPLRKKPADVLVTLMTGRELGLGVMQSLRGIYVIDGKGVASADLIVGLVKRNAACRFFRLVESTDEIATYETQREGEPEPTKMSFTIEQARKANLGNKQNWKNYPAAMLRARCSAALARAVYPDLAMGIYDPDEAEDFRRSSQPAHVRPIRSEPTFTAPEPPRQQLAQREEISEGEIVQEEEAPAEPTLADWHARIDAAQTPEELADVGRALAVPYPKGHPERPSLSDHYARRSAELRRGA